MNKHFFLGLVPFLVFFSTAVAQPRVRSEIVVRVQVESKSPPSQVLGLVLSKGSANQEKDTKVTKIGDYLYEVLFKVPASTIDESSVATALVITKDDQWIFGSMTPTLVSNPDGELLNVPECAPETVSDKIQQGHVAPFKSLVDIRSARADLAKMQIGRLLSDEFIVKLRKAEQLFGVSRTTELSADLPPAELVDRLARLSDAIRDFKKSQQAAQ
jgi:hypothetical protein